MSAGRHSGLAGEPFRLAFRSAASPDCNRFARARTTVGCKRTYRRNPRRYARIGLLRLRDCALARAQFWPENCAKILFIRRALDGTREEATSKGRFLLPPPEIPPPVCRFIGFQLLPNTVGLSAFCAHIRSSFSLSLLPPTLSLSFSRLILLLSMQRGTLHLPLSNMPADDRDLHVRGNDLLCFSTFWPDVCARGVDAAGKYFSRFVSSKASHELRV